ncbi:MAG: P-II family nitrogen regulator [Bacteroidetes bacterium]|nr:P-II family nitrogen regulator [Bacteroidota bacterium]
MKIMKSFIAVILSLSLASSAFADCSKPVQFLKKGVPAPCEGFLFSKDKEQEVRIAIEESKVDKVVDAILKTAKTGQVGDGKIFIYDIGEVIRIRTEESGDHAL